MKYMNKAVLSSEDVREMLGISDSTLHRLQKAGKLPQPMKIGQHRKWRTEDIEAWLAGQEVEAIQHDGRAVLSSADLREMLGIGQTTLHRWQEAGKLPKPMKIGQHRKWRTEDIEAWLKEQSEQAQQA